MEELFRKYCIYYVTNNNEEYLEELNKEAKEEKDTYQKKALKYVKNLRHKTNKLGYDIDFESFCNLLEEYISKKDDLEDSTKRSYLKVLFNLSKLYEVNLREELEKYISYKKVTNRQITERDVFRQFCSYNLNTNENVSEFNRLTKICEVNNLNFEEIHQNSLIFVEEIKLLAEKIGYGTTLEHVYKMIDHYQKQKKVMKNNEKVGFLKLLFYLCELYNLNLREMINNTNENVKNNVVNYLSNNPLENEELISNLLKSRYENGSFKIEDFLYNTYIVKEKDYNYNHELASLTYNIYQQFIDKFNNYAYDDLNPLYSNMITEEDINRLQTLKEDEIENIINEIDKHESIRYICKKFKLPENLYKFIYQSIYETLDMKNKSIGINTHSLFNINSSNNSIAIYLNGPDLSIIELIKKYIRKCIDNNLNYELDGLCYDNNTFKSIIYSNKKDFKQKITIIEDIISNNNLTLIPTLPLSCHKKDKIYSISRRYIHKNDESISYLEYMNNLLEVSYYRIISKIIISKIDKTKDQKLIEDFINLNNFECPTLKATDAKINNQDFSIIKDMINNYIPNINTTLSLYINDHNYNASFIKEFTKSILYISNLVEGKDKNTKRNITIS